MDSMPPATTISDSPSCTACAASATAFNPEPQTLFIVIAATRASQPPLSAACRAGFCPSPACTTLPRMASSICLASRPERRIASATALPPSSGAENDGSFDTHGEPPEERQTSLYRDARKEAAAVGKTAGAEQSAPAGRY